MCVPPPAVPAVVRSTHSPALPRRIPVHSSIRSR
jgi:hypothetical protein